MAVVSVNQELLLILVVCLVNGVFDAVVVAWLAGKRSRQALQRLVHEAATGDEEATKFLYELGDVLIVWASTERIKTGEKVKVATDKVDAEGKTIFKEVDEVLSPIQILARTIGSYVIMKFKGSVGGTKNQVKQMFVDSMAESGGGPSPAALQALARGNIGPMIAELGMPYLMERLKKKGDVINTQGGGLQ